ncbi:MAG: PAS domain S-box protein, partial [Bacteroidota bacterium]
MKHSQNENIYNILEKKEKKYKLLLDNMDDGFILNQAVKSKMGEIVDFRIAEVNPAFEKLTNTEWDDIGNKSLITICPDEHNQKKMVQAGKDALNRGSHQEEHFFPGINKYFRIFYFAYEDDYLAMLFQDISQLKQDIETQSFIASIVESSDDAIFRESPEGKILSWNEGAMNLYGYTPQEAIGKTAYELYCYPKNDGDNDLIEQAGKGKKVKNHETVHRRKDGSTVHVSITKSPIINSKGCVVGIANIAKDITLVKQREAELIKAK